MAALFLGISMLIVVSYSVIQLYDALDAKDEIDTIMWLLITVASTACSSMALFYGFIH